MINYSGKPPLRTFIFETSFTGPVTTLSSLLQGKKKKDHFSISHNPQLTSKVPEKSKILCEMPDICASGLVI